MVSSVWPVAVCDGHERQAAHPTVTPTDHFSVKPALQSHLRRGDTNDPELNVVDWSWAGVGNEEVERLAEALDGNTVLQTADLLGNHKLTDVDRLLAPIPPGGYIHSSVAPVDHHSGTTVRPSHAVNARRSVTRVSVT